ncbi:MAG: hypothetical protein ACOY5R_20930 [Pseudomonadota bacterium]
MDRALNSIATVMVFAAALTGCGRGGGEPPAGLEAIECRPTDGGPMEKVCTIERMTSGEGTVLVVRAPDGSFHRLLIVRDGRGVIAADGAEPLAVRSVGRGTIEVVAGGMQYRLPARVTP